TAPLQYNHPGSWNATGAVEFLPHVANLTHNVVFKSESATGTRGHVVFTHRADVNIQNAQFSALGRTTNAADDDTTFDASGFVTHGGSNQSGRRPVQFRPLLGPAAPPADGYQFVFSGNSVFCPLDPMTFRWGIALKDSHYGLVSHNVMYNWAGAGLAAEDGS